MPQFVVLHHEIKPGRDRESHWDLMLEDAGALLTWALPQLPGPFGEPLDCEKLADHRTAYLSHEGPISGDRGTVTCWDRGEFEWETRSDSEIRVRLTGERLAGLLVLSQVMSQRGCEKMGTGTSRPRENSRKHDNGSEPVPLFSQPQSEKTWTYAFHREDKGE